jgi:hypothetical protein
MAMADVPMSKRSNFDLDFMHTPLGVLMTELPAGFETSHYG